MRPGEKQYHIALSSADIGWAKFAIVTGDPGRVAIIAKQIDPQSAIQIASNREYTTYLCKTGDPNYPIPIIIASFGIGCPSNAIGMEEFIKLGVHTFVRIGTAGSLQRKVGMGAVVIVTGTVREDGTSRQYVPIEYPAVADPDLVAAARMAAKKLGIKVHVGIGHTKDAFYAETGDPTIPLSKQNKMRWETWEKAQVLATSMEAGALYPIASFRDVRCLEMLGIIGLTFEAEPIAEDHEERKESCVEAMTQIAVNAISILLQWDSNPNTCPF